MGSGARASAKERGAGRPSARQASLSCSGTPPMWSTPSRTTRPPAGRAMATTTASAPSANATASAPTCPRSSESDFLYQRTRPLSSLGPLGASAVCAALRGGEPTPPVLASTARTAAAAASPSVWRESRSATTASPAARGARTPDGSSASRAGIRSSAATSAAPDRSSASATTDDVPFQGHTRTSFKPRGGCAHASPARGEAHTHRARKGRAHGTQTPGGPRCR